MAEIASERLSLRPSAAGDVDALHAIASDFEVVRQTATWPWPPDRAFTASRAGPIDPEAGIGGTVLAGGEIVGMMGVHLRGDVGEIGYMFSRAHWGKGYATEIARALIARAWETRKWPAITACVFADNPASARVLLKLGFIEGARCSGPCAARGGTFETRTFRLERGSVFRTENGSNSGRNSAPS